LEAIREFTEFGSGFRIAMRDLEIRGAGNVLGAQQHGHMEAVGYDMYLKLLGEAIAVEKGETPDYSTDNECLIDIQIQAHIPERYIPNLNQRLDIYRRIADIRSEEDAADVVDEIIDRFGDPPASVTGLVDVALLRNTARSLGIYEIRQNAGSLLIYQNQIDKAAVARLVAAMRGRVLLSAGTKPYLSVKMQQPVLAELKSILGILKGDQK
ncbi:MAG: transcription-repair coupling factor, partial [Firmicutes bacterium]|nr:transcription-repair coupling factor [Bacillota bacterium]